MPRADQSAHPVRFLREACTSLEAAVLVCRAKANQAAVHKLRTSSRRVEAQLQLLSMLPALPPHAKEARKAISLLKKLRHAAGRVRDIDVQREILKQEAKAKSHTPRSNPQVVLREEARQLRRKLKHKRDQAADRLFALLRKHETELATRFERLLDALAPAESLSLTDHQLAALVRECYANNPSNTRNPHPDKSETLSTDRLHAIRKRAKLARYLAESAPKSAATAHRLAAQFEKLQQAGGDWHDLLLLSQVAGSKLHNSATLPHHFATQAHSALDAYQRRLRSFANP